MYYIVSLIIVFVITIINIKYVPQIIFKKDVLEVPEHKKKLMQMFRYFLMIIIIVISFYLFLELTKIIPYIFVPRSATRVEIEYFFELSALASLLLAYFVCYLIPCLVFSKYDTTHLELGLNRSKRLSKKRKRIRYYINASLFSLVLVFYLLIANYYFYYQDDYIYKSNLLSIKNERLKFSDIKEVKIKRTKNSETSFIYFEDSNKINIVYDDLNFLKDYEIIYFCNTFEIKNQLENDYKIRCTVEGRSTQ